MATGFGKNKAVHN